MAYDKHTWTCDEPITVERLNHIEDGIANAGGGECGYECEEVWTTLTEESVTTTSIPEQEAVFGRISYSQQINADTIRVTFNGIEYECEKQVTSIAMGDLYVYGANTQVPEIDWSHYPFSIQSGLGMGGVIVNALSTETAGTYTIKIEAVEEVITTTPCFDLARGYSCGSATLTDETLTATVVEK